MGKAKRLREAPKPLKLDLGCGINKKEGFVGVDIRKFEGVDVVTNLTKDWPWLDESVDEVHCSHFLEHLVSEDRIFFVNELYRVLKPGGTCALIVPHWASGRAYGDLTHKWPPVSEMWFYYLDKGWRAINAPHNDFYVCDFVVTWGYAAHANVATRNQEFQSFAFTFYKEAAQDIHATLTKK
jgi:SAM-dependent methyltransferase